jgi:hypothetical protein
MSQPRVLRLEDLPAVQAFEQARAERFELDPVERELKSWHASWRKESLEYYLPLGWSFGMWSQPDAGTPSLLGYFLAQPQLFARGLTQTLWVERLVADNAALASELVEIAYKISREKHFQKVLFYLQEDAPVESSIFQLQKAQPDFVELKTAKF